MLNAVVVMKVSVWVFVDASSVIILAMMLMHEYSKAGERKKKSFLFPQQNFLVLFVSGLLSGTLQKLRVLW